MMMRRDCGKRVYRVREFAELAGVTVKALHHYDRLGLLRPGRSPAGYRLYRERDLERLEQITALKFLGLPLNQIRAVLDRTGEEVRDALRLQISALEAKQELLGRAIRAIRAAEQSIGSGTTAAPALLKRIIEVIGMQDSVDEMKRYFSEEAWAKQRARYEQGPSPEWQALYREADSMLGEDPGGNRAMGLGRRWLEQLEADTGGDPNVLMGKTLAWDDRENWPAVLKRELEDYNLEQVYQFVSKAVLAHRKKFAADEFWIRRDPRAQMSVPWYQIFAEVRMALEVDCAFISTQPVRAQWVDFMHRSTRVDPDVQARSVRAWEEAQERHLARWSELATLAEENVGAAPGGPKGQELAARWMELWDCYLCGDLGVAPAFRKVQMKPEVTAWLGEALAWPLRPYFGERSWTRLGELSLHRPLESLQQSTRSQIALLRDAEAAMREDRAGARAQVLASRWLSLFRVGDGDDEIEIGIRTAWKHRSDWPSRFREHVACLCVMDLETFDSVATFLDEAIGRQESGCQRPHS